MALLGTPQGDKAVEQEMGVLTSVSKSDVVDMFTYPSCSLQAINIGGATGLSLDWEVSNLPDGAWVKYVTAVTESDLGTKDKGLFVVPPGIRYARANVTALTVVGKGIRIKAICQAQT